MKKVKYIIALALFLVTFTTLKVYSQSNYLFEPVWVESFSFNDPTHTDEKRDIFFDLSEVKNPSENTKLDILQCVNFDALRPAPNPPRNLRDASWYKNINSPNFESFPNNFYNASSTIKYKGVVFLKMRNANPQKNDVVVLRDDAVQVYWNINNTISGTLQQNIPLSGGTILIKGVYDADDNVEDAIIYANPNIKIYKNLSTGLLTSTPLPSVINVGNLGAFPVIISAQINGQTFPFNQFSDPFGDNKFDVIIKDDQNIRVYMNDNQNNTNLSQTISAGIQLSSLAVADINNDGYNDIIYSGNNILKIHLNLAGTGINSVPDLTISNNNFETVKAIGVADLNNDGWNDLVLGLIYKVKIFINNGQQTYFNNDPTEIITSNNFLTDSKEIRIADLYNKGSLAVLITGTGPIATNSLPPYEFETLYRFNAVNENPAPAPPIIYKSTQFQGGLLRPKIFMYHRGEKDFQRFKIYKRSPSTNNVLVPIAETSDFFYVDNSEYITESTNGEQATVFNCYYSVKEVDNTNLESILSYSLGYTVGGIPSCLACADGSDNSQSNPSIANVELPRDYFIYN